MMGVYDQFIGYTLTPLQLPTVAPVETLHACDASTGYSGHAFARAGRASTA